MTNYYTCPFCYRAVDLDCSGNCGYGHTASSYQEGLIIIDYNNVIEKSFINFYYNNKLLKLIQFQTKGIIRGFIRKELLSISCDIMDYDLEKLNKIIKINLNLK